MDSVDRLTLVELIEEYKSKLSPVAFGLWEDLDASLYLSPEEEIRLKPHEAEMMRSMGLLPEADQRAVNVLTELRAGLYQSDYSDRLGDPSQQHRDKCVVSASIIRDRDEREPGDPLPVNEFLGRTVDQALTRLREGDRS